jgi:hypothetical protein
MPLTDAKSTQLEEYLAIEIASYHPEARAPKVLSVDDVARIASHFPYFLHDYRGMEFQSRILTFPAWGKTITARPRPPALPYGNKNDGAQGPTPRSLQE